ncbi:Hypothetical predicted protein [Paramuricea clavata]|uniref:Endonuclease/exonuclease/phosphatase domain-containing protein n=1 Tax=Paramuricea clavata TaxID=317549 RepID=A0A6S7HEF9_PARCT|nr:Hypothetical predicted protein [Paramuricea clavata]
MHSRLSISAWNIHGLKHKTLGDKLSNIDFIENVKDLDLIFLTETWSNEINSIPGFVTLSTITATRKSNSACRLSGGISLLFKKEFENAIFIEKQTKNFLWCRIDNTILNSTKNLFICGVYIPPERSSYFDEDIFHNLENDVVYFSKKGNVMLLGDFNARTSKLEDFVSKEGNTFINDITETSFEPKTRDNFDSCVNNHGKSLIEICKNCNLRILNGRTLGDSFGKPTFHNKDGTSVVDYIICDQELTQTIKNFVVKPPTYLSDYSQIVTWINKTSPQNSTNHTTPSSKVYRLPLQFVWDNDAMNSFTACLKSPQSQQKLERLINHHIPTSKDGVNTLASEMEEIILHAARKSLKIKKTKFRNKINNVCNKKWFECRLTRMSTNKTFS